MTVTREWQPHHSEWKAGGRSDPCAGERPDERIRDLY